MSYRNLPYLSKGNVIMPQTPAPRETLLLAKIADKDEREFLAICQHIWRNEHGYITPFEHFIWNLVFKYGYELRCGESREGITPEDVRSELKDFEEHFDDTVKIARYMNRLYPDAVKEQAGVGQPAAA